MTIHQLSGKDSALFRPLTISNGKITLQHRVVHAPLTRNRGEPLAPSTPGNPNRIWIPGNLMVEYYSQRATQGGLMISEGIPPSLEVSVVASCPKLSTLNQPRKEPNSTKIRPCPHSRTVRVSIANFNILFFSCRAMACPEFRAFSSPNRHEAGSPSSTRSKAREGSFSASCGMQAARQFRR